MKIATPFATRFDASLYPRGWLLVPRDEESIVKPAVIERLTHHGALAFPVDSGSRALRGRIWGTLSREGSSHLLGRILGPGAGSSVTGAADVFAVLRGGRACLIECKRPAHLSPAGKVLTRAGEPSEDQIRFLLLALSRGATVGVAWGPSDVDRILLSARNGD